MDVRHPVHPGLEGLVAGIQGYAHRLDPRAVHHGVPSRTATVVISFDDPIDVSWLDGSGRVRRWLLASGMHTAPALIRTHGMQHGIHLSLTPAGCRALLGVPIGALTHLLADHADLPLGGPEHLHARMSVAGWAERFRLLERHLLRVAGRSHCGIPPDLAYAWTLLDEGCGRVRVAELAETLGWSRRHLVNRFTAEFGMPPRDVARLHRFAAAQAYARTDLPWGEVAHRAGYADQAHLSREFRALAGRTPTAWRREAFPIVQDIARARPPR